MKIPAIWCDWKHPIVPQRFRTRMQRVLDKHSKKFKIRINKPICVVTPDPL